MLKRRVPLRWARTMPGFVFEKRKRLAVQLPATKTIVDSRFYYVAAPDLLPDH
jgi:hypothetical protein